MSLKHKILDDTQHEDRIDFETLLLSTLLIEKFRFGSVSDTDEGIDKEFEADLPTKEEVIFLKENLVKFLFRSDSPLLIQQAISTLGRTGDEDIAVIVKPFLHRYLRQMLEINTVIYSSLVALDECGEAISDRESFQLNEFDLNIAEARDYLKSSYDIALPGGSS